MNEKDSKNLHFIALWVWNIIILVVLVILQQHLKAQIRKFDNVNRSLSDQINKLKIENYKIRQIQEK